MRIYKAGSACTCASSLHINTIQRLLDHMKYLLKNKFVRHEWIALRIALDTMSGIGRVPPFLCLSGTNGNSGSSVRLTHSHEAIEVIVVAGRQTCKTVDNIPFYFIRNMRLFDSCIDHSMLFSFARMEGNCNAKNSSHTESASNMVSSAYRRTGVPSILSTEDFHPHVRGDVTTVVPDRGPPYVV